MRLDIQSHGFVLTLQALGMDFKNSEGLCGNFDGISINDLSDLNMWSRINLDIEQEKFNIWSNFQDASPMCQCFSDSCLEIQANFQKHALNTQLLNSSHNVVDMEFIEEYNTNIFDIESTLMKAEIFKFCSNILINSSIAMTCGPYLDRDIMFAVDVCISGKFL